MSPPPIADRLVKIDTLSDFHKLFSNAHSTAGVDQSEQDGRQLPVLEWPAVAADEMESQAGCGSTLSKATRPSDLVPGVEEVTLPLGPQGVGNCVAPAATVPPQIIAEGYGFR